MIRKVECSARWLEGYATCAERWSAGFHGPMCPLCNSMQDGYEGFITYYQARRSTRVLN